MHQVTLESAPMPVWLPRFHGVEARCEGHEAVAGVDSEETICGEKTNPPASYQTKGRSAFTRDL
jgi:hypothetical protein